MIITPLGYFIARVFLDTFSNLLFSTKAEDYAAINQQRQLGKQIGEAVDILSTPKQLLLAKQ